MNRLVFFIGVLFLSAAGLYGQSSPETYAFDKTSHDFGTLKVNQTGTAVFKLTNTGTAPLVLFEVKVSCNCAKVEWPRQPVLPGGSAELVVTYKDRDEGAFYKVVEVVTNGTPKHSRLRLKGSVEK